MILDWPYPAGTGGRRYDVSPDGQRFLAIRVGDAADSDASVDITVVLNWFTELKERMGR